MSVYLDLLSHFLPFKIHVTNVSPILIKMVDFKNLAWATSFATRASRKFIYLPYRASGKKVIVIPWLDIIMFICDEKDKLTASFRNIVMGNYVSLFVKLNGVYLVQLSSLMILGEKG